MIVPLRDALIVQPAKLQEQLSVRGILVTDRSAENIPCTQGKVLYAGAHAQRIKVGDTVVWGMGAGRPFEHDGAKLLTITEDDVIATI